MGRSIFGWSYPPGCSGPPEEQMGSEVCEVCGHDTDTCICPECPKCKAVGDVRCYDGGYQYIWSKRYQKQTKRKVQPHGMKRSLEQHIGRAQLHVEEIKVRLSDAEEALYWLEQQRKDGGVK